MLTLAFLLGAGAGGGGVYWYLHHQAVSGLDQLAGQLGKVAPKVDDALAELGKVKFPDLRPKSPSPAGKGGSEIPGTKGSGEGPANKEPKQEPAPAKQPENLKAKETEALPKIKEEAPRRKQQPEEGPPPVKPPAEPKENVKPAPPLEPPPAKIADADWKEFASLQGRFRVLMPGAPKTNVDGSALNGAPVTGFFSRVDRPEARLTFQASLQLVLTDRLPKSLDELFGTLHQGIAGPAKAYELAKETEMTRDGLPTKEFHVRYHKDPRAAAVARFALVREGQFSRVIGVAVWGAAAAPDSPEVRKFFDSLKIEQDKQAAVEVPKGKEAPKGDGPKGKGPDEPAADGPNATPHAVLKGPGGGVPPRGLRFSADSKEVLAVFGDKVVRWDLDSRNEKGRLRLPAGMKWRAVAVADDGKTAVVLGDSYRLDVVDLATGKAEPLEENAEYKGGVTFATVGCSPDGKTGASVYQVRTLKIWDVAGKTLRKAATVPDGVRRVVFSPDGKLLVTTGMDRGVVTVWDATTGAPLATVYTPPGGAIPISASSAPAFSHKGDLLAVGIINKDVRLWDAAGLKPRPYPKLPIGDYPSAVAISPDRRFLLTGTGREGVRLWDLATGQFLGVVGRAKTFNLDRTVAFSPDGQKVATTEDGNILLWDVDKLVLEKIDPEKNLLQQPEKADTTVAKGPDPGKGPRGDPARGAGKEVLKVAGAIEPHLSLVVDEKAGAVLATQAKAVIKLHSYPDFKLTGSYRLEGTAYRAAYDRKRGLLYALVPSPKAKPQPGRLGGNDVHVYAVDKLLAGKVPAGTRLSPSRVLPLDTFATQLLLSPDGESLYFLDAADLKAVKVGRLGAAKGERGGAVALAENTDCLCLSPDGKKLYAGSHVGPRSTTRPRPHQGSVQVIDTAALKLDKSVPVPIDVFSLDATDAGVVFASGGSGTRTEIAVLDVNQAEPVTSLWKGAATGLWLRLSGDGKRLYLSNWRSRPAVVTALRLPEKFAGAEWPPAVNCSAPSFSTRGAVTLTADGRFLVCESGVILRLREGD
jgi:DNA-binding beta-propeller fold protein YncE